MRSGLTYLYWHVRREVFKIHGVYSPFKNTTFNVAHVSNNFQAEGSEMATNNHLSVASRHSIVSMGSATTPPPPYRKSRNRSDQKGRVVELAGLSHYKEEGL